MLAAVAALAGAGKYDVNIDKSYPLAQAGEAQEYNRAGHSQGKVILIIDSAKASTR